MKTMRRGEWWALGTGNGLAGLLAQTRGGSDREWGQARGGVGMALGAGVNWGFLGLEEKL